VFEPILLPLSREILAAVAICADIDARDNFLWPFIADHRRGPAGVADRPAAPKTDHGPAVCAVRDVPDPGRFSSHGRFPAFSHGKSWSQLPGPDSVAIGAVDNGFAYRDSGGDPLKSSVP
jgi:hypothetical protein